MAWSAPAKLNLMLHVVGRRHDGYHELQTVFQLIDLCDRIEITVRTDGVDHAAQGSGRVSRKPRIWSSARPGPCSRSSGTPLGAEISVEKRIPMGGGLGGGSSDAATTLVALNQMWQTGLTSEQIAAIGVTLGADVPVFVAGRSAWAEGIGEKLTPVRLGADSWYLVIFPGVGVPTAVGIPGC